eukprot:scaffold7033_cov257-Pinguiococcus_pyrenoidosus.AAC.14
MSAYRNVERQLEKKARQENKSYLCLDLRRRQILDDGHVGEHIEAEILHRCATAGVVLLRRHGGGLHHDLLGRRGEGVLAGLGSNNHEALSRRLRAEEVRHHHRHSHAEVGLFFPLRKQHVLEEVGGVETGIQRLVLCEERIAEREVVPVVRPVEGRQFPVRLKHHSIQGLHVQHAVGRRCIGDECDIYRGGAGCDGAGVGTEEVVQVPHGAGVSGWDGDVRADQGSLLQRDAAHEGAAHETPGDADLAEVSVPHVGAQDHAAVHGYLAHCVPIGLGRRRALGGDVQEACLARRAAVFLESDHDVRAAALVVLGGQSVHKGGLHVSRNGFAGTGAAGGHVKGHRDPGRFRYNARSQVGVEAEARVDVVDIRLGHHTTRDVVSLEQHGRDGLTQTAHVHADALAHRQAVAVLHGVLEHVGGGGVESVRRQQERLGAGGLSYQRRQVSSQRLSPTSGDDGSGSDAARGVPGVQLQARLRRDEALLRATDGRLGTERTLDIRRGSRDADLVKHIGELQLQRVRDTGGQVFVLERDSQSSFRVGLGQDGLEIVHATAGVDQRPGDVGEGATAVVVAARAVHHRLVLAQAEHFIKRELHHRHRAVGRRFHHHRSGGFSLRDGKGGAELLLRLRKVALGTELRLRPHRQGDVAHTRGAHPRALVKRGHRSAAEQTLARESRARTSAVGVDVKGYEELGAHVALLLNAAGDVDTQLYREDVVGDQGAVPHDYRRHRSRDELTHDSDLVLQLRRHCEQLICRRHQSAVYEQVVDKLGRGHLPKHVHHCLAPSTKLALDGGSVTRDDVAPAHSAKQKSTSISVKTLGAKDGLKDGPSDGPRLGDALGLRDGPSVGPSVGPTVGPRLGSTVGTVVGTSVGSVAPRLPLVV